MKKMSNEEIKDMLETNKYVVGMHHSAFLDYMKATDGNVELSLKLAHDFMDVIVWGRPRGGKNENR